MIRYRLHTPIPDDARDDERTVYVTLDSDALDKRAKLTCEGPYWPTFVGEYIKIARLSVSPRELFRTMRSAQMARFSPVLEEGSDLFSQLSPADLRVEPVAVRETIRYRLTAPTPADATEEERRVYLTLPPSALNERAMLTWDGRSAGLLTFVPEFRKVAQPDLSPRELFLVMRNERMERFFPVLEEGHRLFNQFNPIDDVAREAVHVVGAFVEAFSVLDRWDAATQSDHNFCLTVVRNIAERWLRWEASYPSPREAFEAIAMPLADRFEYHSRTTTALVVPTPDHTACVQVAAAISEVFQETRRPFDKHKLAITLYDRMKAIGVFV